MRRATRPGSIPEIVTEPSPGASNLCSRACPLYSANPDRGAMTREQACPIRQRRSIRPFGGDAWAWPRARSRQTSSWREEPSSTCSAATPTRRTSPSPTVATPASAPIPRGGSASRPAADGSPPRSSTPTSTPRAHLPGSQSSPAPSSRTGPAPSSPTPTRSPISPGSPAWKPCASRPGIFPSGSFSLSPPAYRPAAGNRPVPPSAPRRWRRCWPGQNPSGWAS
jgi:hypothetical protein